MPNNTPSQQGNIELERSLIKLQTVEGKYVISTLGVSDPYAMDALLAWHTQQTVAVLDKLLEQKKHLIMSDGIRREAVDVSVIEQAIKVLNGSSNVNNLVNKGK